MAYKQFDVPHKVLQVDLTIFQDELKLTYASRNGWCEIGCGAKELKVFPLIENSIACILKLGCAFCSLSGFHSVDIETGRVLNVHLPLPLPKTGILPLNMLHVGNSRVLLHDSTLFAHMMVYYFADLQQLLTRTYHHGINLRNLQPKQSW